MRKTSKVDVDGTSVDCTQLPTPEALEGLTRLGRLLGEGVLDFLKSGGLATISSLSQEKQVTAAMPFVVGIFRGLDPDKPARDLIWLCEAFARHSSVPMILETTHGQMQAPRPLAFEWKEASLSGLAAWFTHCVLQNYADFFLELVGLAKVKPTQTPKES